MKIGFCRFTVWERKHFMEGGGKYYRAIQMDDLRGLLSKRADRGNGNECWTWMKMRGLNTRVGEG